MIMKETQAYLENRIVAEFPYRVRVLENIWITLKDGVRLSARAWLPETDEKQPLPAILEYIPYRKRDGTRKRDEPMHGYFAGHGYAVIRVDMRGSGESDGLLRDEYLRQEQEDALEVIDWISRQEWCGGDVGMMGKSWGGFNSLQVAALNPPALKAVLTVGFTDDRYNDDIHYKGGCLLNDNLWWGAIMFGYQSRPADPALVGEEWRGKWLSRLENMPCWPALWMGHQTRDDYWKHGSVCEDYAAIQCPVFAFDGWADAYSNTVLRIMENLSVPRRAIIGPWAHVYPHDGTPSPAIGFLQEAVKWWDHWLKGKENGVMDEPMVQAWLENHIPPSCVTTASPGRWICSESWPSADVTGKIFHLSHGRLSEASRDAAETVKLKTPLNHGLLSGEWMGAGVPGESPSDQRLDDGMAMVFETESLSQPFEIFGYPHFEVDFSSDKEAAMLFAQLSDVAPDGSVKRVSYGVINLTHLEGHGKVVPLQSGKKVKAHLKLDCAAHQFPAGHRIRLSLATTFWPMFWPMPEEAELALDLHTARFSLPAYSGPTCAGPEAQPESAPLTPCATLTEGHVDRSVSYDILTDTWTCITNGVGGVFGEGIYRFDEIDVTVEHNLKRELLLTNGDPLSAQYNLYQKMRMGREGWWTDTDIFVSMRGDKENFYVTAEMKSKENGEQIFEKKWNEKIPRNGI